ncbi:hypothetical protein [Rubripirellula reticaptiva]|uniref:Uncharacterized protein n=1 Tax=Rubripirellula reticaptiva TaxID=2528013 RepID=A0A5C6EWQ0_9BACT|nr:hypothetical protein [Rubripirellula reticaptiva]TWU51889.1 hypothetical protein Poly59_34850 [Rubripirellula reticaptiva]
MIKRPLVIAIFLPVSSAGETFFAADAGVKSLNGVLIVAVR